MKYYKAYKKPDKNMTDSAINTYISNYPENISKIFNDEFLIKFICANHKQTELICIIRDFICKHLDAVNPQNNTLEERQYAKNIFEFENEDYELNLTKKLNHIYEKCMIFSRWEFMISKKFRVEATNELIEYINQIDTTIKQYDEIIDRHLNKYDELREVMGILDIYSH